MSRVRILAVNSVSNIIVSLTNNVISVITLPLYLTLYGDTLWGIYLWGISISGVFGSFDFGVKAGLRRFSARFTADKKEEEMEIALSMTAMIMGGIALLNAIVVSILAIFPKSVMSLDQNFESIGRFVLLASAVYALLFWGKMYLEAIMEGFQLYVNKNLNLFVSALLKIVIYLLALFYKIDFLTLVVLLLAAQAGIPFLLHLFTILYKGLLRGIRIRWRLEKKYFESDFFKFSTDVFILGLLQMLTFKLDKIIIGVMLGAGFVTKYVLVTKPMFIIKMIDSYLFSAIQPMIAKEQANENEEFLGKIITKGSLLNFLVTIPICVIIILLLRPFIHLWVGEAYDPYIFWGQIAAAIFFLKPFYGVIAKFLLNMGITKGLKEIRVVTSFVNITVSIIATYFFGIGGVILGTLADNFFRVVLHLKLMKDELDMGLGSIVSKKMLLNIAYVTCASIASYYIVNEFMIDSWIKLILVAFSITIILFAHSAYVLLIEEKLIHKILKK